MNKQRTAGSALIATLFLIVVVGVLGAFALRIGANQQQTINLTLLETRAEAEVYSALEFGSSRAQALPPACFNGAPPLVMAGYAVIIRCRQLNYPNVGVVFELTATASFGAYGNPDFVQRTRQRRVSSIPPTSY